MKYTLTGPTGGRLEVLDLGATVTSYRLVADDPTTEVVVGFDDPQQQKAATSGYFGAVVGRYANRIAGGRITVDGVEHQLETNEGTTTLHGGPGGVSEQVWTVVEQSEHRIRFELTSPDGDQGFPGTLAMGATYELVDDGFTLDLDATTDAPTPVCLTSHLFVNLGGGGTIQDDLLTIAADEFVPIDAQSIPVSGPVPVEGTPFDFRMGARIGDRVRMGHEQIGLAMGIDHSFDLVGEGLRTVATVENPATGRRLELVADAPALQVYTGNFLNGEWISRAGRLRQGDALALEPDVHPDSPNQDWADDVILRPGEQYRTRMEWHFTADRA